VFTVRAKTNFGLLPFLQTVDSVNNRKSSTHRFQR